MTLVLVGLFFQQANFGAINARTPNRHYFARLRGLLTIIGRNDETGVSHADLAQHGATSSELNIDGFVGGEALHFILSDLNGAGESRFNFEFAGLSRDKFTDDN